jgi:hypothetical protein
MTIVFGHNNFIVKSVSPTELGILNAEFAHCSFELRQKYGHLFWIPFFPMQQFWVLRKPNGNLYECPTEIEDQLERIRPKGMSVFAFAGPIIGLAAMILIPIYGQFQEMQYKSSAEDYLKTTSKKLAKNINSLEPNDYLVFEQTRNADDYYGKIFPPIKVISTTKDSVTLGNMFEDNLAEDYDAHSTEISNIEIAQLVTKNGIKQNYTIPKSKLMQALPYDADNNVNKGAQIAYINLGNNITLKNIVHAEGPILQLAKFEKNTDYFYLEFENAGFDAIVDSVIGEDNNKDDWKLSANHNFKAGKAIALKANNGTAAKLYCTDANKHRYIFDLKNYGGSWNYDEVEVIK